MTMYIINIHRKNGTRKGMHYHVTPVRSRKRIIRQIESILHKHNLNPSDALTVCKYIVQANSENRQCAYKYHQWYLHKNEYLKLNNHKFNIQGQGRKRTESRQKLFDKVTDMFKYYRYECGISVRLYDVADFFIKAAKDLEMQYDEKHSYEDAKAWQHSLQAGTLAISGKIKFKAEYIAAKVAENQAKLLSKMRINNITQDRVKSLDETMVWHDFCVGSVTLSLPGQNTPVFWIPNDKDTTTFVGIWEWNQYVQFFRLCFCVFQKHVLG